MQYIFFLKLNIFFPIRSAFFLSLHLFTVENFLAYVQ